MKAKIILLQWVCILFLVLCTGCSIGAQAQETMGVAETPEVTASPEQPLAPSNTPLSSEPPHPTDTEVTASPEQPLVPSNTPLPSEPPLPTYTDEPILWEPIIVGDPMDLVWCTSIAPGNGLDQYSLQAYQREDAWETKLVLVNADGITLQTIERDDCAPFEYTGFMPYLEDLNMDGYADLVIPTNGTFNQGYCLFAWIPTQSLFEPVEIISGADSTNCITDFEVRDGYIAAWAKESVEKIYYQEYIWLDIKTLSLNVEELIILEMPNQEEWEDG